MVCEWLDKQYASYMYTLFVKYQVYEEYTFNLLRTAEFCAELFLCTAEFDAKYA